MRGLRFDERTLATVWQWLLPRLRERPVGAEADRAVLPACWQRSEDYQAVYRWDDETVDRATAVAYLLGQVVVHSQQGARWTYSSRKNDAQAGEALVHVPSPDRWISPLVVIVNALLGGKRWGGRSALRSNPRRTTASRACGTGHDCRYEYEPRLVDCSASTSSCQPASSSAGWAST